MFIQVIIYFYSSKSNFIMYNENITKLTDTDEGIDMPCAVQFLALSVNKNE